MASTAVRRIQKVNAFLQPCLASSSLLTRTPLLILDESTHVHLRFQDLADLNKTPIDDITITPKEEDVMDWDIVLKGPVRHGPVLAFSFKRRGLSH